MIRGETIKEEIRRQLRSMADDLKGYRVVLFGSRAAGGARPRSDFDVGVLGERPLPVAVFFRVEDRFNSLETLQRIDWVDLNQVDPSFRENALKHVEVLYAG